MTSFSELSSSKERTINDQQLITQHAVPIYIPICRDTIVAPLTAGPHESLLKTRAKFASFSTVLKIFYQISCGFDII